MNLLRLAELLRRAAVWLETRYRRKHPYVRKPEHVRRDIQNIMEPWPNKQWTYNDIYCRSSMGSDLERGLEEMTSMGFVSKSLNGAKIYKWEGKP